MTREEKLTIWMKEIFEHTNSLHKDGPQLFTYALDITISLLVNNLLTLYATIELNDKEERLSILEECISEIKNRILKAPSAQKLKRHAILMED